ncbi:MAG: helix-turn-helix transcriptional regulator, partial [Clostridia bacterium]
VGFSEYVTSKRLTLAKQLLQSTDSPIAEIALRVGIQNANYFSKLFKASYGNTPFQFRMG